MKYQPVIFTIVALLCMAVLAGCTLPASTSLPATAGVMVTADYTAAVQTQAAILTREASTLASAQPPTAEMTSTALPDMPDTATPVATNVPPTAPAAFTDTPTVAPTLAAASPTPAVTPTPTPLPQPTFPAGDVRAALGAPSWVEPFDGSADWYKYEDKRVRFQAENDKLLMTAFKTNFEVGWALAPLETASKFYLEMTVTSRACGGLDRFGLMLSPNNEARQGYLFDFSCDGRYSLWIWDGDTAYSLIPWTTSALIRSGPNQVNRIGIKVDGDKLALYANGTLLQEVVNKRLAKVYFGVFVGASQTADYTVEVSEMDYWELK